MKKKDIYTSRDLYIHNKEVEISRHALIQARKREILPDMVEAALLGGTQKRFGKNFIKFIQNYKHKSVICIGEDIGQKIIIKTIEWGNKI